VITRPDGHLLVPGELAVELLELLDLLGEVLRYGSDDLRDDIADRFHPRMHAHLVEALDVQAGRLRRATTDCPPSKRLTPR
jgi:hypothetical protein